MDFNLHHGSNRGVFSDWGARWCSWQQQGRSMLTHYRDPADYQHDTLYMGALVGRYANRIAHGYLQPTQNQLTINESPHHLHGGHQGFSHHHWKGQQISDHQLIFTLVSPDGDEGYPGQLQAQVTYSLPDQYTVQVEVTATANQMTPVNLVQHAYFSLDEQATGESYQLHIPSDRYLAVDQQLIPTQIRSVANSPFDFRKPRSVQQAFDHSWLLGQSGQLKTMAQLMTGNRQLTVSSTQPALHVYTTPLNPQQFNSRFAIALEAQNLANAPNRDDFPDPWLKPGQRYYHCTRFQMAL